MSSETKARNYKLEALTGLWAGDVNKKLWGQVFSFEFYVYSMPF